MHPALAAVQAKMRGCPLENAGGPANFSQEKAEKKVCMQGVKFEVLKKSAQNFGSFAETTDLACETTGLLGPRNRTWYWPCSNMVLAVLAKITDFAREHC